MSARAVQMYSGVESVRAADELRRAIETRRDSWPYPHEYPPPNSEDVCVIGTALTQSAVTGATLVVTYQVNSGKRFYLRAVVFSYFGGAFLPGDATFTVDRNSPIGITNSQFLPEHGLINVPVQLGSFNLGFKWRLDRAREFEPLDIVRIKATNVNLAVGAGNVYACGLFGYELPVLDVKATR